MSDEQPNNPLHGVTLRAMLEELVERHGWVALSDKIRIRCFQIDPSFNSSLKFLRKTEWARSKVEQLYLADQKLIARNKKRNKRRAAMRAQRALSDTAAGEAPDESGASEDERTEE